MRQALWVVAAGLAMFALISSMDPELAWAGAGGVFKSIAKSRWGQIGLALVGILLLPLILYVVALEKLAAYRTRRHLEKLRTRFAYFDWGVLNGEVRHMVERIHAGWTFGSFPDGHQWMTDEYLETCVGMIERWRAEGKRNHLRLQRIRGLAPMWVSVEDELRPSLIAVQCKLEVLDYLEDLTTGAVLKGTKEVDDGFEAVYVLRYEGGRWRLAGIEADHTSIQFAKMKNVLDTGWLERERTAGRRVAASGAGARPEVTSSRDEARGGR